MEPRQQAPGASLEQFQTPQGGGEHFRLPEVSQERAYENRLEHAPAAETAPAVPQALPVVQVDSTQQVPSATPSPAATSDDPALVAADEDLIEKEWVDKAKKIIEETKDDPYRREQEVGRLQREYIRKRYGREVGESGDQ